MKQVKIGDVFFAENPLNSADPKVAKRLAYLLGTVCARPVVIIREPQWWDPYNTVTVLPAISKCDTSVRFSMIDRNDHIAESDYTFVPANPHTIPVARLGKYIGSLEPDELDELLEAFIWAHTPRNPKSKKKVPKCYEEVMKLPKPSAAEFRKDSHENVKISVSRNLIVKSTTNPELNGLDFKEINLRTSCPKEHIESVEHELGIYVPEIIEVAPTVPVEPVIVQPEVVELDPVQVSTPTMEYPKSIFSSEDLEMYCSRFYIDSGFYDGTIVKRDSEVLDNNDIKMITFNRTHENLTLLFNVYNQLEAVDAIIFVPRLPTNTLERMLNLRPDETCALKRMCNRLRDMSEDEYQERLKMLHPDPEPEPIIETREELYNRLVNDHSIPASQKFRLYYEMFDNATGGAEVKKILEFLTPTKLMFMKPEQAEVFVRVPVHIIKKHFKGTGFQKIYNKAYAHYRKILTQSLGN